MNIKKLVFGRRKKTNGSVSIFIIHEHTARDVFKLLMSYDYRILSSF